VQINQSFRFSVAPMMDWTDRHCRYFHRRLSRCAGLYSEMITTGAVLHGERDRLLGFDASEQPVAIQLGGSEPAELARAAKIAESYGYTEINLNCGCPSDRVQNGAFGACLMREPERVGEAVAAMKAAVKVPVTVKSRIGVDEQEPEQALFAFTEALVAAGVDGLIVHARKAWLKGLSPKENRQIPPLDYPLVYRLKAAHPTLPIALNGGIDSIEAAKAHLQHVDGVMIGRAAYQNPALLLAVDPALFGAPQPLADSFAAADAMVPYLVHCQQDGVRLADVTRHMLGLFAGQPGARDYRRFLSTMAARQPSDPGYFTAAVSMVKQAQIRAAA
jgi:tRNA-dihydrouridine synthase A